MSPTSRKQAGATVLSTGQIVGLSPPDRPTSHRSERVGSSEQVWGDSASVVMMATARQMKDISRDDLETAARWKGD